MHLSQLNSSKKKNEKILYGFKMVAQKQMFASRKKKSREQKKRGAMITNIFSHKFCGFKMAEPKNEMLGTLEPRLCSWVLNDMGYSIRQT